MIAQAIVQGVTGKEAADAQHHAAMQALAFQKQMFDTTKGELQPFINAGQSALNPLMGLASGDPAKVQSQLEQLPGYQFTQTQGLKAVQNSAAARGLGTSGAALKGAATYSTGLANSTFGDQFSRLLNLGALGSNSASALGGFATQTGANVGNSYINAGNAQAAGYIGIGNAASNYLGIQALLNSGMLGEQAKSAGVGGAIAGIF